MTHSTTTMDLCCGYMNIPVQQTQRWRCQ